MRNEIDAGSAWGMAESSPVALFLADEQGAILHCNASWRSLLEIGTDQFPAEWFAAVQDDDRANAKEAWQNAARLRIPFSRDLCLRTASGQLKWVRVLAHPVYSEPGNLAGFSGAFLDLSAARRAEADIQDLEARLDHVAGELQRFAFSISHDLQEPLRVIGTFAELLTRANRGRLDRDSEAYLLHITAGVDSLRTMVQGLLDYSRAINADPVQTAPIDLAIPLGQALDALRPQVEARDARIIADPLPVLDVNQPRFVQLFRHLVENALRFNKRSPSIRISALRQDFEWIISVADNGIGIDPRYHDQIFQVFKRLHSRAEYPGHGIGLAVCRAIVELHNGQIWVESVPGEGSAFNFSLPAAD